MPADTTTEEGELTPPVAQLSLSVFELDHLCALKGVPVPPPVAYAVAELGGETGIPPVVVHAGLFARGLLGNDDDGPTINSAVDDVLTLLTSPGLVVRIESDSASRSIVNTIYAMPDRALLESSAGPACLTYRGISPSDLVPILMAATGLELLESPDTSPEAASVTVPLTVAAAAAELVAAGDGSAAVSALLAAGAEAEPAVRLTSSLAQHRASCSVAITHQVDGVRNDTLVAWSDCGSGGLWLLEQQDPLELLSRQRLLDPTGSEYLQRSALVIREVTAAHIMGELLAGLPDGN